MTQITKFDYKVHSKMVSEWGKKYSFPIPPEIFLSDIAYIVNDAAVGFLYTTNSQLAWIEFVFSNPEKTKEERAEALDRLLETLMGIAKEQGFKAIFSYAGSIGYERVLKRNEFMETDKNMNHYIRSLGV